MSSLNIYLILWRYIKQIEILSMYSQKIKYLTVIILEYNQFIMSFQLK
jgi:hypothetical protein